MILRKSLILFLSMVFCASADDYPKLVAEWDFSKPDVLTAGKFPLTLRKGAVIENRLLVSQTADKNIPGGAQALKIYPGLDINNAFSVEALFEADPAANYKVLFDSKYNLRSGYMGGFMLALHPQPRKGKGFFRPFASFGYGKESRSVYGNAIFLEPGKKYTLRMVYTAIGKVLFFLDGKDAGSGQVKMGGIAKSRYKACIGDRINSGFNPFGKGLAKLSLYKERPVLFRIFGKPGHRTVFERGEEKAGLHYVVFNNSGFDVSELKLILSNGDEKTEVKIENLKNGKNMEGKILLDTALLPGSYSVKACLIQPDGRVMESGIFPYTIVPAYGDFLPLLLTTGGTVTKYETAREFGFTHLRSFPRIFFPDRNGFNERLKIIRMKLLDESLANGIYQQFALQPTSFFSRGKEGAEYLRRNRKGEPYRLRPLDVNHPGLIKKVCDLTIQCAEAIGDHPALDLADINSEYRDSMESSFGGTEEELFKKFSGYPIPKTVVSKYPRPYKGNPLFPWDRVLPENNRELTYYRWLWKDGDGWNNLHSRISDILHQYMKHHHTTYFEPAVRVPPIWGSGGRVDAISHWTYTNPDPIKINYYLDGLCAMAAGRENQTVLKETQIIWYRSATAPIGKKPDQIPDWVAREPKAKFITIPPDCLRESIWYDISHRVQVLSFHGPLFPTAPNDAYRYTNPDTKFVFKDMAFSVLKPLGPVIKRIPERKPEVAILESFTSYIYNFSLFSPHTGRRLWIENLHTALQWAHIQPSVIYEDHLLSGKNLENVKVILLPGVSVLSENVLRKLQELQKRGVVLIGDEYTLPALMPDFRIASVKGSLNPEETKAQLQKLGREVASRLKSHYISPVSATDQDIILRRRGTDDADYLFIVNDKRTYGDYLGPWKLVMEKGVPAAGTVTVSHPVKTVYDLVKHTPVPFQKTGKGISFRVGLAPGNGQMLLLLNQRIASLKLNLPNRPLKRREAFTVECSLLDENKSPVRAIIPLEVLLTDAKGTRLPGSGFYAAEDGKFTLREVLASNMSLGKVTVTVKDLASGLKAQNTFEVTESRKP